MANATYTGGGSTPSLVVSSSGVGNPCESRDPPSLPSNIGVNIPAGYDLMTYQRLASVLYAHPSPPTHLDAPTGAAAPPTPPGHPSLLGTQEHLLHGGNLDLKDGIGGLGSAWPYPMYYPYDTLAAYPFTHGYGMSFDAARRKNATRETTATLKAWLNEHKKNPYPTKGEKIMLAIITKMTLTQVSTWFANARRRLKKENKMTWEPRNKTDDDDDDDDLKDDLSSDNERRKDLDSNERPSIDDDSEANGDDRLERTSPSRLPSPAVVQCSTNGHSASSPVKPRIWSLADMAASSSTSTSSTPVVLGASKFLHRPLHLETSPYGRPLSALNPRLASPQEALLQVYAKSLGLPPHAAAAFPPLALNGFGNPLVVPHSVGGDHLPPPLISHSFSSATLSSPSNSSSSSSSQISISRPVATRPLPPMSPLFAPINHQTLPGGAKITPALLSGSPPSPVSSNGDGAQD